jgi:hypothetical protein
MFFERCEVVSAHDGGSWFPPYVTALIPAQIDSKLIYIPKTCASSGKNDFSASVWEDRDADENSVITVQKRRE